MVQHRARRLATHKNRWQHRLRLEPLEDRLYLHGGAIDDGDHTHLDVSIRAFLASSAAEAGPQFYADPVSEFNGLAMSDTGSGSTTTTLSAATYALSSLPLLSSLSGASASLFLDFNGDFQASWGSYSNITTPVFSQDSDLTTFSDSELATIQAIWQQVAEDYAPFKINVTTVEPASFANGVAERIAIGGNGSWTGGTYGGVSYVNSFTSSIANAAFVFPVNLVNGYAKYTAEAASHEAGHAFGLQHQKLYNANGSLASEYYAGPGDGRAPIMGNSYSATRGLWWYGTSTSSTTYQDDMAVISRSTNAFGYRADDYGNSAVSAAPLAVSGTQLSGAGVITQTSDVDYFSFSADAGQVSLWVNAVSYSNLDARLELRDSGGVLIASADPSGSFGASLTATVAGGSYRLVVASHGNFGDVGQYTVGGTIVPATNIVSTPTNLAAILGNSVDLSWADNAANETFYEVARSTDGVNWTIVATLAADSTAYSDENVAAGGTYYYRVRAGNATQTSDYSNQTQATLAPLAPSGLAVTAVSSSQINLAWNDVSGESSYKVQRSSNGTTWTTIATVGANITTYQSTGLAATTTYFYRVVASNAGGDSAPSDLASGTTMAVPTPPSAPAGLVAVAAAARQVNLTWQDTSLNENGFRVERSQNGGKSWTLVGSVGANSTIYVDGTVNARKTYLYRVRAFNDGGNSAYSNVAKVTLPAAAPLPLRRR